MILFFFFRIFTFRFSRVYNRVRMYEHTSHIGYMCDILDSVCAGIQAIRQIQKWNNTYEFVYEIFLLGFFQYLWLDLFLVHRESSTQKNLLSDEFLYIFSLDIFLFIFIYFGFFSELVHFPHVLCVGLLAMANVKPIFLYFSFARSLSFFFTFSRLLYFLFFYFSSSSRLSIDNGCIFIVNGSIQFLLGALIPFFLAMSLFTLHKRADKK